MWRRARTPRVSSALVLLLLAQMLACDGERSVPGPELAATAPAAVERVARALEAVPDQCGGVAAESVAAGWIGGPMVVPGDGIERALPFSVTSAGWGVVVVQNGDGQGVGNATGATVVVGPASGGSGASITLNAGQTHAAGVVALYAQSVLKVRATGGGSARVSVASLGSVPCSLVDATVTRTTGGPNTVTRVFARPDGSALGVVVLIPAGGNGTKVDVELNGVAVASNMRGSDAASAKAVALGAGNTLTMRATGQPGGSVRALVLDADTTGPEVGMTAPADRAVLGTTTASVEGTRGSDVVGVDVNGQSASLRAGGYSAQVPLVAGAQAVTATAADYCGNRHRVCRSVASRAQAPTIVIEGVADGTVVRGPVVPSWSASDPYLVSSSATLNGQEFVNGSAVTAERPHELVVTATNAAGLSATQSIHFTIDDTAPEVGIQGVEDTHHYKVAVTPVVTVSDANPFSSTVTLNELVFASGTTITEQGEYALVANAVDLALNEGGAIARFVVDWTAPQIEIAGVVEGERRNSPATITFTATDLYLQSVTGTEGGSSIESGAVISGAGPHVIEVVASDRALNEAQASRSFYIDTQVPTVAIESPADGTKTTAGTVEMVVSASDDGPMGTVSVGATTLTKGGDGKYRGSVTLSEGTNVLEAVAFDAAGNSARASVSVVRDTTAPQVVIATPEEGTRLTALSVSVTGTVTDATAVTLTVNGAAVAVQGDGSFSATVSLSTGLNTIAAVATDAVGNSGQATRSVRANATAPVLTISEPADGTTTIAESILVRGTVTPGDASDEVAVTVDGASVGVSTQGEFQTYVTLAEGPKTLVVVATDGYGLKTERSLTVTRAIPADAGEAGPDAATPAGLDAGALPGPDAAAVAGPDAGAAAGPDASSAKPDTGVSQEAAPMLMVSAPSERAVLGSQSVGVSGQVQGGTLPVAVKVNGTSATVSGRYFSAALALAEGEHSLGIEVTDAQGRTASAQRNISVDRTAPDLAIDVPGTNPAAVTTSPFRIEGEVGDAHLGGVTVNGEPAFVMAGRFSASVALSAGDNAVVVEATDLAGNRQTVTQHLTIEAVAPTV
ncbi:MAG: hypothetical protein HY901_33780, partial [Deltaproteobacteria bacterium]|nr:hypothetical protein [Deltaproteobacteria bacterium]